MRVLVAVIFEMPSAPFDAFVISVADVVDADDVDVVDVVVDVVVAAGGKRLDLWFRGSAEVDDPMRWMAREFGLFLRAVGAASSRVWRGRVEGAGAGTKEGERLFFFFARLWL